MSEGYFLDQGEYEEWKYAQPDPEESVDQPSEEDDDAVHPGS